jgi:hypothetical protein
MRLENWYVDNNRLIGNVYGNPKFVDGDIVQTSKINHWAKNAVRTLNSTYVLGKPFLDIYE